jgi:hypothetical protein
MIEVVPPRRMRPGPGILFLFLLGKMGGCVVKPIEKGETEVTPFFSQKQ